jgi:hypothetical protein
VAGRSLISILYTTCSRRQARNRRHACKIIFHVEILGARRYTTTGSNDDINNLRGPEGDSWRKFIYAEQIESKTTHKQQTRSIFAATYQELLYSRYKKIKIARIIPYRIRYKKASSTPCRCACASGIRRTLLHLIEILYKKMLGIDIRPLHRRWKIQNTDTETSAGSHDLIADILYRSRQLRISQKRYSEPPAWTLGRKA